MVARAGTVLLAVLLIISVLVGRLPASWLALFWDQPWLARAALVLLVYLAYRVVQSAVYATLPMSPVLWLGVLRVRMRGHTQRIPIALIDAVLVDRRPQPEGEVLVVRRRDGEHFDVCPTHWSGAMGIVRGLHGAMRSTREERRNFTMRRGRGPDTSSASMSGG